MAAEDEVRRAVAAMRVSALRALEEASRWQEDRDRALRTAEVYAGCALLVERAMAEPTERASLKARAAEALRALDLVESAEVLAEYLHKRPAVVTAVTRRVEVLQKS